jgi:hypothetical protein
MTGCVAINPTSTANLRAQDGSTRTEPKTMLNYSDAQFGASPTWQDGQEIIFTNCSMIDGEGREWNTGARAATAVGKPARPTTALSLSYPGDYGCARITLLK